VSKNSGSETAQSSTWKFYNVGESETSYAPFPAELVAPKMGSRLNATTVTLSWAGSDVDNDIDNYDVLFGTLNPPNNSENQGVTDLEISINVTSGNTYYWQVITHDKAGNNSTSEVFQFRVD
jgi:hypothetical protein